MPSIDDYILKHDRTFYEDKFYAFKNQYPWLMDEVEYFKDLDHPYFFVAFMNDGSVKLFDVSTGDLIKVPQNNKKAVIFSELFRKMVILRGMNQKEFSKVSGIPTATVNRYWNGNSLPKSEVIFLIAKTLDCPVEWFSTLAIN